MCDYQENEGIQVPTMSKQLSSKDVDTSEWTADDWYRQEMAVNDATLVARQAAARALETGNE